MKEKIYLEKKDGKVIAYFVGNKAEAIAGSPNIIQVKKDLEEQGYIVELKE